MSVLSEVYMKRLLCTLLLLGLVGWVQAQEIVFTSDTLRKWADPGDYEAFYCDLENTWNQSNDVALRMDPHLPASWNVAICTKLGCSPPGVLYVEYTLDPLEVDTLVSVDIITSAPDPDSGWVITYAMSLEDTNTYRDTLTHTLITYENGIIIRTQPGIPDHFRLAQNYPNPFNPSTTISISIPDHLVGQDAELWVYDILGREVRRLYRGSLSSGVLTITWDGRNASSRDMPSGTYFYRFSAGQSWIVRSMQLVR